MSTHENIYLRILKWAYDKGTTGFTRKELRDEFNLEGDLAKWVEKNFFSGMTGERPLFSRITEGDGDDHFTLTEKGMAVAVDYFELQEARRSSKIATRTAIIAIIISAVSTFVSIGFSWYQIKHPQSVTVTNETFNESPCSYNESLR